VASQAAGAGQAGIEQEEHHNRRDIGYWQLTAIGSSGVIGPGWLLAALNRGSRARAAARASPAESPA
jgi:hypothetical protein